MSPVGHEITRGIYDHDCRTPHASIAPPFSAPWQSLPCLPHSGECGSASDKIATLVQGSNSVCPNKGGVYSMVEKPEYVWPTMESLRLKGADIPPSYGQIWRIGLQVLKGTMALVLWTNSYTCLRMYISYNIYNYVCVYIYILYYTILYYVIIYYIIFFIKLYSLLNYISYYNILYYLILYIIVY